MSARKSKRRSSFAAGRIQLEHGGELGGEIHKHIDGDRPQDERLAILTRQCLQYTLQKLEEEMTDFEDFQSLKKEIEIGVLKSVAEMEETGVFHKACTKDNIVQNPINLEMDEVIEHLEDQSKRLQEEADKWESMITDLDQLIAEREKEDENEVLKEEDIPVHIKSQAADYLCDKINYTDLLTNLQQDITKTSLLVDEHTKNVNLLQRTHIKAENLLQRHTNKLQKEELKEMNAATPRKLIKNLLSLPSPKS